MALGDAGVTLGGAGWRQYDVTHMRLMRWNAVYACVLSGNTRINRLLRLPHLL